MWPQKCGVCRQFVPSVVGGRFRRRGLLSRGSLDRILPRALDSFKAGVLAIFLAGETTGTVVSIGHMTQSLLTVAEVSRRARCAAHPVVRPVAGAGEPSRTMPRCRGDAALTTSGTWDARSSIGVGVMAGEGQVTTRSRRWGRE